MTRVPQTVTYSRWQWIKEWSLKQNKGKPQKNHDASAGAAVVGENAQPLSSYACQKAFLSLVSQSVSQ